MPTLAEVLRAQRDRIVARFVNELERTDLSPSDLPRSILADHIPLFLDEIAGELTDGGAPRPSRVTTDTSATARQHGEQRAAVGYDLEALVREYGVLRYCILATAKDFGVQPSTDEFEILMKHLTVGIAEAVTAYTRDRDEQVTRQKERLEFLAEAGRLLSSSLDYRSTISQLTNLLVPRLADWCVVHIDGVPDEVLPPKPAAHSTIEVPLRIQEHTFGTLTLAYGDSKRTYDEADVAFATELAGRAAFAIDNARLYALSQRERARVEAATRAKDDFVAMVSHELRTPLNAILGWVRLIRTGTLDPVKYKHGFEVIERNAEVQSRLVADLLDISRTITGRMLIAPSQVELATAVELALEAVRPAADAKRIKLEIDLGHGDTILRGDGERLQQVAWNLVANAVKFTTKNGVVKIRLRRVDSDVELVVEDNGEGIAAEFLPHVFEIFQQAERGITRPHGGLGIGLSITKHIVDLHGGTISAQSAGPGTGATFTVRLPISPLVSTTLGVSRVPATATPTPHDVLASDLEGIKVLVVDDDRDARDLLAFVLESCGVEVRVAASVPEAIGMLITFSPDVICSDIGLPDEDGYSLIRQIRSLPAVEKRDIPAIALTAFGSNEDRSRALVEGFNIHLAKPVEPAALVRAVLQLVPRR